MKVPPDELERLAGDLESFHVERKSSVADGAKIRQAICAFANDLPASGKPGYLFVGLDDLGNPAGTSIDERLIQTLLAVRTDGQILPQPQIVVEKVTLCGAAVAVVEVQPSPTLPVRYKGQVWVRLGARRDVATREEERRLVERDVHATLSFDRRPCLPATLEDLNAEAFRIDYLPRAVAPEVIAENQRSVEYQMASLRFYDLRHRVPTIAGILGFGHRPIDFLPGTAVQFTRYAGRTRADLVVSHRRIEGTIPFQVRQLEELLSRQIQVTRPIGTGFVHQDRSDYPLPPLRELVLNALLHRTYEGTSAPVHVYWFTDRVEILSPGGLYGHVTPENFDRVSDYRNPVVAEMLKTLGFVERFGSGIARVRSALSDNGNPEPRFQFAPTDVQVTIRAAPTSIDVAARNVPMAPMAPTGPEPGTSTNEPPDTDQDTPDAEPSR